MSLTQPQRIQISGEMLNLPLQIQAANDANTQITAVKTDLQNQDNSLKIFFDKYNDMANAYQTERRWVDGTTYSTIINQDLIDAAKKSAGNKFYPGASWTNFKPQKHPSSEGLPTTSSTGHEIELYGASLQANGLTALIDFLLNGQTSGVADDTLAAAYSPGAGTMTVTTGGQTPGKFIIIKSGSVSGLFLVTAAVTTTLTVTEVIPPSATLAITSSVKESITAFTNSERNLLVSANYQDVLIGLTNNLVTSVTTWDTILTNQLTQLNLNLDSRSPQAAEITTAKASINTTKGIITTWQALPSTGTTGTDSKFVNSQLSPLQGQVTSRTSYSTTRFGQITTALGTITQAGDGSVTGAGIYFLRFVQIDSRINLAGGPLTEFYEKDVATAALTQIATTSAQKGATFDSELKVTGLANNASGTNVITVTSALEFSVSNTVFVMADTLTELTGTITGIAGPAVTLSFTVPNTYTKDLKARLYKQL